MITRAAALAAPLRQFQAWHMLVFCERCRLLVRLDVDRLVSRQGDKTVGAVVQRLRCSRCGSSPASITMANGAPGGGQADMQRVELSPT